MSEYPLHRYKRTRTDNASSVEVGLSDTYGAETVIDPSSGFSRILLNPYNFGCVWGGTFNGDTITVRLTVTYDDDSTTEHTSIKTSAGAAYWDAYGLRNMTNNKSIKQLSVAAKTDQASTSVTVIVRMVTSQE
ncbi:hypothetical protein ES702_03982 [subsurface metagenome]